MKIKMKVTVMQQIMLQVIFTFAIYRKSTKDIQVRLLNSLGGRKCGSWG